MASGIPNINAALKATWQNLVTKIRTISNKPIVFQAESENPSADPLSVAPTDPLGNLYYSIHYPSVAQIQTMATLATPARVPGLAGWYVDEVEATNQFDAPHIQACLDTEIPGELLFSWRNTSLLDANNSPLPQTVTDAQIDTQILGTAQFF